jgi:hypothetical protein
LRRGQTACAQHRVHWHVDLKHKSKRCAAPEGCGKLGIFKRRLLTPSLAAPPHNTETPRNQNTEAPPEPAAPTAQAVNKQLRRGQTEEDMSDQDWSAPAKLRSSLASPQDERDAYSLLKATHQRVVFVCAAHSNLNVFLPLTKDGV